MAPLIHHCIERFSPDRRMFESNCPVDKVSYSYNAFKRLSKDYFPTEYAQTACDLPEEVAGGALLQGSVTFYRVATPAIVASASSVVAWARLARTAGFVNRHGCAYALKN